MSPAPTSSVGGWNASPVTSLEALGTLGSREVDESDDRNRWSEELLWSGQWEEVGGGTGEAPGVGRLGLVFREEEDLEEHCRLSRDGGCAMQGTRRIRVGHLTKDRSTPVLWPEWAETPLRQL